MLRMWRLKVREMEMELLTLWADTVDHFTKVKKMEIDMKYIDPTYMIRALPSNASDNISCTLLAQSAVHGAMAGYTGFTVGPVNSRRAYIPIARGTEAQNTVKLTEDVGQTACFYKSA